MTINIERHSGETSVSLVLHPVPGKIEINTPSGFLGHMLELMAHNAGWGLSLKASGDAGVDLHHLVEDTGIVLGKALLEWYPSSPRNRYGWCAMPMDGSLVMVAVDLSGRGVSVFRGEFPSPSCGIFDMELVPEFFRAFARESRTTIHIRILESDNSHHTSEAIFKGIGRAMAQALTLGEVSSSTKGIWP
ncbi:MAG: imidazoleglycerol-phosphate dehydratase [Thermovirgaceae bacterium]|nr:imidazoleglycerol-phosphate dehydratase [Thermovirgaceae bacterium]